jgi:hypothetical protein
MPNITPLNLSSAEKDIILARRLPERMFEVYIAREMIRRLSDENAATIQFGGDKSLNLSHGLLVANSFLDAGILMSRALLDFLGIYRKRQGPIAQRGDRPNHDDLMIVDLDLPNLITVDDVYIDGSGSRSSQHFEGIEHLLFLANKTIGHLTPFSAAKEFDTSKAEIGFDHVLRLVNRHVYAARSGALVSFETTGQPRYAVQTK